MIRTTLFAIILGTVGAPVLAHDARGNTVPAVSMKDKPVTRDAYRHETTPPEQAPARCLYDEDSRPVSCEPTTKAQGAPDAPAKASGAR
jgi:hypothetical protein